MALSYDLAMQGYFALYASTMTTFPDQCVTGAPAVERASGIANAQFAHFFSPHRRESPKRARPGRGPLARRRD